MYPADASRRTLATVDTLGYARTGSRRAIRKFTSFALSAF
jgi:hypothetical protein